MLNRSKNKAVSLLGLAVYILLIRTYQWFRTYDDDSHDAPLFFVLHEMNELMDLFDSKVKSIDYMYFGLIYSVLLVCGLFLWVRFCRRPKQ